jgi:uncharacterized membrane protein YqhA
VSDNVEKRFETDIYMCAVTVVSLLLISCVLVTVFCGFSLFIPCLLMIAC